MPAPLAFLFLALTAASGPAPAVPAAPARAPLNAKSVIVQLADLPVVFGAKSGGYKSSSEYVAMYLRPEVISAESLPQGGMFGVMAGVVVSPTAAAAEARFVDGGGLSPESIRAELAPKSSKPSSIAVTELAPVAPGTDHVVGFRVAYELQGEPTVEYRYRVLSGSVVANIIVAARAGARGAEPEDLSAHAAQVLQKQVERILAARAGRE